jgi:hypothetical protein
MVQVISNYQGTEAEVIEYLTSLWSDNTNFPISTPKNLPPVTKLSSLSNFKSTLNKVSSNLVFQANFGAYSDKLEKELSLTKKQIKMNNGNTTLLYHCLSDLIIYDNIRPRFFNKIKCADLFEKLKKGDNKDPKNFRYLSNHHKVYKIIDKFWCLSIVNILKRRNKLPDKNIVKNALHRKYNISIRDQALEKLISYSNGTKVVLLDISKAFDSVSWYVIKDLLTKNLTRKVDSAYANKLVKQYLFLIGNRIIKFKNNIIKMKKSIATGLPSSTLVFSLLIEQIIYQWQNLDPKNKQLKINTYVDDIFIEFLSTDCYSEITESLINYLGRYNLKVNPNKTKTNIVSLPYSQLASSDTYLGLPFANSVKTYIKECITMYQNKHHNKTAKQLVEILLDKDQVMMHKTINGFFNYKFYGLNRFNDTLFDKKTDVLTILLLYYLLLE